MTGTQEITAAIVERSKRKPQACLLVAISGIDASGKSTLARRVVDDLNSNNRHAMLVGLDLWHTPPPERFNRDNPAEHFYHYAFRFDELFELLINPLRRHRSISLTTELTRLPQNDVVVETFDFDDVDVIVLEGIFLFKRALKHNYDLSFWLECSFETALQRAIARNQEGLSAAELVRDFQTIYFPAQEIHFARDHPNAGVDWIVNSSGVCCLERGASSRIWC